MAAPFCAECNGPVSLMNGRMDCARCAGRRFLAAADPGEDGGEASTTQNSWTVGGYQLSTELGRGAMGVVYRARQPGLNRDVALKVILASRFAGVPARKRFLAEAGLAAGLDHPNIVPIYEVGETPEGPFYAMKLMEGGTLADRIPNPTAGLMGAAGEATAGPDPSPGSPPRIDVRESVRLMTKLARAVQHAHQRGVLHRDLKPGNILLDAEGQPHISDFGLACDLDAESSLTVTGSTLGTPAYMAPEQTTAERGITTAADVWSLGAILFHMLTGRVPFVGSTATDVLLQVRGTEPCTPRLLNPAVPHDVETICLKCLEKDPSRRYGSALSLAEDLERWLADEPIHARPTPFAERTARWIRKHPAAAIGTGISLMLVILGLGGVAWQWRRAEGHSLALQHRMEHMAVAQGVRHLDDGDLSTALPWFLEALVLSGEPQGERAVKHASSSDRHPSAHRTRFATTLRQMPALLQVWFHDGPVMNAVFSPDGLRVFTVSGDGKPHLWDAFTGEPGLLGEEGLLVSRGSHTDPRVWDHDSGVLVRLLQGTSGIHLSDSRELVLRAHGDRGDICNGNRGAPTGVSVQHGGPIRCAAFSPNGLKLLTGGENGTRLWRVADGEPLSPPIGADSAVFDVQFSPDGSRFATATSDGHARIWETASGTPLTRPMQHGGSVQQVRFSPDGTWILTASDDHTARVWDAASGTAALPPLWHGSIVRSAVFSPDGRRVLTASLDGLARLWNLDAGIPPALPLAGTERLRRAWLHESLDRLITVDTGNLVELWSLTTGAARMTAQRTDTTCNAASLSPDGRTLATAEEGGPCRLWDVADGRPIGRFAGVPGARHISWRPDGRQMVSCGLGDDAHLLDPATRTLMTPPLHHENRVTHAAYSGDGSRVATVSNDRTLRIWDTATGRPVTPPLVHDGGLRRTEFSHDGRWVATTSVDGTVRLWEVATATALASRPRHGGWANDICFSADNRHLLSTSDDGTARLWDILTGRPVTAPLRLEGSVWQPRISRSGTHLLACNAASAQVWETASGMPLTPLLQAKSSVLDVAFTRDHNHVLMVTADRRIVRWDIAPTSLSIAEMGSVSRLITGRTFDSTGSLVPLDQTLDMRTADAGPAPENLRSPPIPASSGLPGADGTSTPRSVLERDWIRIRQFLSPPPASLRAPVSLPTSRPFDSDHSGRGPSSRFRGRSHDASH